MSRWVVDASPLIFLAKLDRLLLLRSAAEDVLVPDSVLAEIRRYDDPATAQIELACETWLQPTPWAGDGPEPWLGELAVIGLALQKLAAAGEREP